MFFNWATINVSNMEKSLAFYQELLGLEFVRRIGHPEDEMYIIFLGEEGKTQLELIQSKTKPEPTKTISFGFTPDNLEEILAACKDSAVKSPGGTFWFVNDPDGYRIQLIVA